MPNDKESKSKKPPVAQTAANDPILARYYADIHNIAVSLDTIATVTPAEKLLYADIHSIAQSAGSISSALGSIDKSLAGINGNTAEAAENLESINESLQANNTKLLVILAQIAECVCGSNVSAQSSTLVLKPGDRRE